MKAYRVYQVDSFTRERFHGNPAGVVANANGLSEEQMQQIARELNNSETAFIFQSDSPDYDVEVRFFTPLMEVPICGHATIAAHYVLAKEKKAGSGRVVQKTKAGILPVDVVTDGGDYSIIMTQGKISVSKPLGDDIKTQIAGALNISMDDYREDCPICIASTGHSKVMVGIRSKELLDSLKPNLDLLSHVSSKTDCNGYYVFTLNPGGEALVHGRMFAPAIGISEDPVTGNANGPLGAYLVHYNLFQDQKKGEFEFKAIQGEAIKRDGSMMVRVNKEKSKPTLVQITGNAVIAFSTEIVI